MSDDAPAVQPDELAAITGLAEPTRRRLYEHIAATGGWVSRDHAADAVGVERATAAHHLDRLAADGLLEVEYRRLSGRQGPGAGRPAKLYRRARREFDVTLPPRDYALAGRLLADAVERSRTEGTEIALALNKVATDEGRRIGEEIRTQLSNVRRPERRRAAVLDALSDHGFEPHRDADGTIALRNCPFHQLAQRHTDLICGMNHCLLKAAVDNVVESGFDARLEPEEGRCCVTLHPKR